MNVHWLFFDSCRQLLLAAPGVEAIGDLGVERAVEAIGLSEVRTRRLGPDLLYTAEVQYSCSPDS